MSSLGSWKKRIHAHISHIRGHILWASSHVQVCLCEENEGEFYDLETRIKTFAARLNIVRFVREMHTFTSFASVFIDHRLVLSV